MRVSRIASPHRFIALLAILALLLAVTTSSAFASGPPERGTFDPTGDTIVCGDTTYTFTSGSVHYVVHEVNGSFTATLYPRNTTVTDGTQTYHVYGAAHFAGTFEEDRISVGQFSIVEPGGGVVDRVSLVMINTPQGQIALDLGTCEFPE
jgi:hypothetical protein